MRFDRGEIRGMCMRNNMVLLRPIIDVNQIQGTKLLVDTTYKPEHHAPVVCDVISAPGRLIYSRKPRVMSSMEWKTEKDLKVGDVVWCNYLKIIMAMKRRKVFCDNPDDIDGIVYDDKIKLNPTDTYIMVPYDAIYLIVRDGKVIMLNGFMLVELEEEKIKSSLILPKKKSTRLARVKYLGEPNIQYQDKKSWDDDRVRKNDLILLQYDFHKKLENPLHAIFDGGKDYVVTQRNKIIAILR